MLKLSCAHAIALTLAVGIWAAPAAATSGKGDVVAATQKQLAKLFVRSFALEKAIAAAPAANKAKLKKERAALLKKALAAVQQLEYAIHKKTGRRPAKRALIAASLKRYAPAAYKTMQRKLSVAQRINTKTVLSNAANGLQMFRLENKRLPTNKEGLAVLVARRIMQKLPKDGWGSPIIYERIKGPAQYLLRSAGPDRKAKTRDDMLLDGAGKWRQ